MTDQIIKALTKHSTSSELSSNFIYEQELNQTDLQIEVEGIGPINLPIDQETIKKILKISADAKFGLREQTLLDKNIRDTQEIPADKLQVKYNEAIFTTMLNEARISLGLSENAKLIPHLHNMLIYGEDQFFKNHQDSEKLDNMMASLVLVLPSPHIGGDLVIKHHDEQHRFVSEQLSSNKIKTIAFYADCQHEVKKIKQGYRVALTYNLVLESAQDQIEEPANTKLEAALKDYFYAKRNSPESLIKLVYFLDHSYSEHGLKWSILKGDDRKNALAFKNAAKNLDLIPHLALVEIHKTWTEDDNRGNYDGEFIDGETNLSYWLDENNQRLPYQEISVSKDESCWTVDTSELEPNETEHEGYMGNYGNTVDYWYRRAAVVLWKKSDQIAMNFDLNYDNAIKDLENLTKTLGNEKEIIEIINNAKGNLHRYSKHNFFKSFAEIAHYIHNKNIANSLLSYFELNSIETDNIQNFIKLQNLYGVTWCVKLMNQWIESEKSDRRYGKADLRKNIYSLISNLLKLSGDSELAAILLDYQFNALKEVDKNSLSSTPINLKKQQESRINTAKDLLEATRLLPDEARTLKIINHLISIPKLYPPIELSIVITDNPDLEIHKSSYLTLGNYIVKSLAQELDKGLREQDDWSIEIQLPCNCEYCKTANEFLQSETEVSKIWPIVQNVRMHLINEFLRLGAPVVLSEQKTGSPHKLVMIKTEKLYQEAKERFERAKNYYSQLTMIFEN